MKRSLFCNLSLFAAILVGCSSNSTQSPNAHDASVEDTAIVESTSSPIGVVKPEWTEDILNGLKYHKISIHQEKDGPSALVLYLHGGCSVHAGDPFVLEWGHKHIEHFMDTTGMKGIIIMPIYERATGQWANIEKDLKALIDAQEGVDAGRIYVTGTSDGGEGTYAMMAIYPNLFAAAMPVAAGTKMPLTDLPTCIVVETGNFNASFADEVRNNSHVLYGSVNGNHGQTCQQAHSDVSRLRWLFQFHK